MATIAQEIRQEGRQEGIEIGIKQEKLNSARRLLELQLHDLVTISEVTGLTLEEVQVLADELLQNDEGGDEN